MGDAILEAIVSEHLFSSYPNKKEGFLSKKRAAIVNRKHLNKIGKKLIKTKDIQHKLKIIPDNVFGNTLEAIIGAIYIDKKEKQAKNFIKTHIINSEFFQGIRSVDYKNELQKKSHKTNKQIQYRLLESKGPDHNKEFIVGIFVDNIEASQGKGASIKEAEQKAAKKALKSVF